MGRKFVLDVADHDAMRSEWLPASLIEAQRDFFGAQTYERINVKGVFHTEWRAVESPSLKQVQEAAPAAGGRR